MDVEVASRAGRTHLRALRLASRSGHIRKAALALGRVFADRDAHVVWPDGAELYVDLRDPYWARLLVGWVYEPEVEMSFRIALALHEDAVLFDVGANIGYWLYVLRRGRTISFSIFQGRVGVSN